MLLVFAAAPKVAATDHYGKFHAQFKCLDDSRGQGLNRKGSNPEGSVTRQRLTADLQEHATVFEARCRPSALQYECVSVEVFRLRSG